MQNKDQRPRLIGGIFIILMGSLTLIQNMVTQDVAIWLWISGLTLSAAIFLWAFTYEKEAWAAAGTYVTGAVALLICLITQANLSERMIPIVVLLGVALPFFAAWWVNRTQWGFLIPAYILIAVIPILFLEKITFLRPEIMPAYVLFAVALPFLSAYYVTRKIGLLAPGGALFFLSIAFFGVSLGLSSQILTIIIPIVFIFVGVYLLLRTNSSEMRQQQ
jgi:hypothetical protein